MYVADPIDRRVVRLDVEDRRAVLGIDVRDTHEADRYVDLLERARVEFDPDRLTGLLAEAEAVLADNALIYPLVQRQSTNAIYWPDRIQGITPNRIGGWHTWNAAWWRPGG